MDVPADTVFCAAELLVCVHLLPLDKGLQAGRNVRSCVKKQRNSTYMRSIVRVHD
jgi:hypothetical protein